jgi:glucokinase
MNETRPVLAVDMGGTKVAAAVVTPAAAILARRQEPTCQTGPADGIRQVARLLEEVMTVAGLTWAEVSGIGIGIPAVLEPETDFVVWAPNLAGWRNVNLRDPLQEILGRPVCVEYDGHTAVLAEWWVGAGRGCRSFVDVIIGTGIGGGMVQDGRLVRGVNRLAGAAGWFVLTEAAGSPALRERSVGFWEARAAGPGIALHAAARAAQVPGSALAALMPEAITAQDVFVAAASGDEVAQAVLDETADLIGLGLANIVSLVNPERIVLGGGVGAHCEPLLPRIRRVVADWAQPVAAASCEVVVSTLEADAGLLGAAYGAMLRLQPAP